MRSLQLEDGLPDCRAQVLIAAQQPDGSAPALGRGTAGQLVVPGAVAADHVQPHADRDVLIDRVDARRAVVVGVPVVHPELGDPAGRDDLAAGHPAPELAADGLGVLARVELHLDRLLAPAGHLHPGRGGMLHLLGPGGHVAAHRADLRPQLVDQDHRRAGLAGQ
jgi:hypothetical protein